MPGLSSSFSGLLPMFQEPITIYHRAQAVAKGDYNQVTWDETSEVVQAHFQTIKAENPIEDQGILRDRQANLFLSLDQAIGENDQVESAKYPGVRWAVMGIPYKSNFQTEVQLTEVHP